MTHAEEESAILTSNISLFFPSSFQVFLESPNPTPKSQRKPKHIETVLQRLKLASRLNEKLNCIAVTELHVLGWRNAAKLVASNTRTPASRSTRHPQIQSVTLRSPRLLRLCYISAASLNHCTVQCRLSLNFVIFETNISTAVIFRFASRPFSRQPEVSWHRMVGCASYNVERSGCHLRHDIN